jgi:hypothetical protein
MGIAKRILFWFSGVVSSSGPKTIHFVNIRVASAGLAGMSGSSARFASPGARQAQLLNVASKTAQIASLKLRTAGLVGVAVN